MRIETRTVQGSYGTLPKRVDVPLCREERGSSWTVALDTRPSGIVAIEIGSDNPDVVVLPSLITFSTVSAGRLSWSEPQRVQICANEDDDRAHEQATITHRVRGDSAAEYAALGAVRFGITVRDDDAPADAAAPVLQTAAVERGGADAHLRRGSGRGLGAGAGRVHGNRGGRRRGR